MLAVICGSLGSGKTLMLTALGYLHSQKRPEKVVSNYEVKYPYEKFSMYKFVDGGYDNTIIMIDEAYTLLESRNFMSSENQAMSYVLFQSRKKSLEMILTVQLSSTLDLRFRELCDIYIRAEGLKKRNGNFFYEYTLFPRGRNPLTIKLSLEGAEKIYKLYNTNEVIEPMHKERLLTSILRPEEKMVKIEQFVNEIMEANPGLKITKGTIKLWLFEHKEPESLMPYIYEKVRQRREAEKQRKEEEK